MNTKMLVVNLNHQLNMIDVEFSLARQTDHDYAEQRRRVASETHSLQSRVKRKGHGVHAAITSYGEPDETFAIRTSFCNVGSNVLQRMCQIGKMFLRKEIAIFDSAEPAFGQRSLLALHLRE